MALKMFVAAGLLATSRAFPIESLTVGPDDLETLNSSSTSAADKEALATNLLLPAMQDLFRQADFSITIDVGDIDFDATFPDQQVDYDCLHRIWVQHPEASGSMEHSSTLSFGFANVSWEGLTVFADAEVDAKLEINTGALVKSGLDVFGACTPGLWKQFSLDILSDGHTGVGIDLTASNAHIALVDSAWSLVFNFHADVMGKMIHWNVDQVTADNCVIHFLDIPIISLCGFIEEHVQDAADKLTSQAEHIEAPKLLQKLEDKLNTAIGDEVVIPLKLYNNDQQDDEVPSTSGSAFEGATGFASKRSSDQGKLFVV
eukprot:CAMPEP_0206464752 /NCGR_PEP_ID=MMETSP0324_2-20121206/27406_1 /ASSEMBLY_ACC=CAM_ASM_000836 /TAXON_ID=2866 /ORGANISM="Crypthecodinium cohnii, Strain Seligo" /LENGTH=315 /DNA_ID=CAMNT_0053937449 /DNA_START=86 /DNA_END=1033 /DNA_ORIENTATION=-